MAGQSFPDFRSTMTRGSTAPVSKTKHSRMNMSMGDVPNKIVPLQASSEVEKRDYKVRGRQISLGECKMIFEKVWRITMENCNHKEGEAVNDHIHPKDVRFE